jgi:hypothetical protein
MLVVQNFWIIHFDNRAVGKSTWFNEKSKKTAL